MPRDLTRTFAQAASDSLQPLSRTSRNNGQGSQQGNSGNDLSPLHVFTQTLTSQNVDSCTRLEKECFSLQERATKEKFQYRLKVCPELTMGIFTSSEDSSAVTAESATPVDSNTPARKMVLLGHIVSTRSPNMTVTDDDMALPDNDNPNASHGHKEQGGTVCLHSLAVLPAYQHQKLATILMKAYISRLKTQDVAQRIALIAHDYLLPFYERLGFKSLGQSKAQFGGGGWYDMVLELDSIPS